MAPVLDPAEKKIMSSAPSYKLYHPKWYRHPMPIFWWLRRWSYIKFIGRELTSLAVGYSATLLVIQIWALSRGQETYERFAGLLRTPAAVGIHILLLLCLMFHTITWLNLAPKAMVLRLGDRRLPPALILAGHYLAWFAASALVLWLLVEQS